MIVTPLFSKPIYYNRLDLDTEEITSIVKDKARQSQNNRNGNNNDNFLYILNDPELGNLKNIILKEIAVFANEVLKYKNEFRITTSWATVTKQNESGQFHNHTNCILSGVVYIKTEKNCGNLVFQDFNTRSIEPEVTEWNVYNCKKWSYEPNEGDIIIFPSEVNHMIETNNSDSLRHSVAFNAMPTGFIGSGKADSQIYFR